MQWPLDQWCELDTEQVNVSVVIETACSLHYPLVRMITGSHFVIAVRALNR